MSAAQNAQNQPKKIRITVVAADGLSKREVFRLPDPFAVITVDAEQTHTTSVIKKTLNPYWNESFDIFAKDSSVIAVQIFDQRKFKKRDQGFLGVVNIRVADVIDLELGGHGGCILSLAGAVAVLVTRTPGSEEQVDTLPTGRRDVTERPLRRTGYLRTHSGRPVCHCLSSCLGALMSRLIPSLLNGETSSSSS